MHALRLDFEFYVNKLAKIAVLVVFIDPKCKWRIRATKSFDTNFYIIQMHIIEKTCLLEIGNNHHCQLTSSIIGDHMQLWYRDVKKGFHFLGKIIGVL